MRKWSRQSKVVVALLLLVTLVVLVFFGTQIALYINFLLGYDTIVGLTSTEEHLELVHGASKEVTFDLSVSANPFCSAACTGVFEDVGQGNVLDRHEFTLEPGLPRSKRFALTAPTRGTGVSLYRYSVNCHGVRTFFCHTDETEETTRTVLLTAEYTRTPQETQIKENVRMVLDDITKAIVNIRRQEMTAQNAWTELHKRRVVVPPQTLNGSNDLLVLLSQSREFWDAEDFIALEKHALALRDQSGVYAQQVERRVQNSTRTIVAYNSLVTNISRTAQILDELRSEFLTRDDLVLQINRTIGSFGDVIERVQMNGTLAEKEYLVGNITIQVQELRELINTSLLIETIRRVIDLDTEKDILCTLTGFCLDHPLIEERAALTPPLITVCNDLLQFHANVSQLNASFTPVGSRNGSLQNVSDTLTRLRDAVWKDYLRRLPRNATNTPLLEKIIVVRNLTSIVPAPNMTQALVEAVFNDLRLCNKTSALQEVPRMNITPVVLQPPPTVVLNITFPDQPPICCVFGTCQPCCDEPSCREDPATYPLLFLHGHAVNQDVSAEYSLEGFNKIQRKLEGEGYLNGGTITLFTRRDTPRGIWADIPAPIALRGSYYFDIFRRPESYVAVQTKSENMDTYAIRLKELIDIVRERTGRPKVTIVAFSMGGLVTRRYLQIFGDDAISKVILIGVANKGIVGDVADVCPLVGAQLECRDMNEDSLFMNKLNAGTLPKIPIYNIVGTGCDMDGRAGDGAVLEDHARVDGFKNFVVKGTCRSAVKPLHLELRDTDLYPEVYHIIRASLKE